MTTIEATPVINLTKGQNINMTKENPNLVLVSVGLGWDVATKKSAADPEFDLDASLFALNAAGKCPSSEGFVYFRHLTAFNGAIKHTGDNLTGAGDGDDETIQVDLSKIPDEIRTMDIVVNIYDAARRKQSFGQVSNAFARVYETATGKELAKFDLTEDMSGVEGVIIAQVYRKEDGFWKFKAIGTPANGGLSKILPTYGLSA